ncbi:uncharacterized protein Z518_02352 [Rhinocladiella mackenziei CBS 650.93]|uniref:J domain-containing protein n=1 Tax=Rhinocladiella mackenziei CBS 650.93 TaxID=1442369 RepID=A0A0D2HB83_9EURO|nr:uncharacterized protein Z518_02352 [Rhinocladiella mackenziei CBS 650.93]KIX07698.1 hypothetical protein Z518_02352 [Rhinocladiella mackenziei CBS 650.93]
MAEAVVTQALSLVGWAFLPAYATAFLQSIYYRLTIRAGSRHPQPGEPLFAYHNRRIRVFVLSLYLCYTLIQALYDVKLAGDFYTLLGVTPWSMEREVKSRFRKLASKYHPDKLHENGQSLSDADTIFVQFRLAHDTILDPAKRFAYDRFGPVIVQVQQPGLKSIRDYVYAGLRSKVPEYVSNAAMLVLLNYIWLPKWGQFWRYFAVACMASLELYFLTHTWEPPRLATLWASMAQKLLPQLLPPHLLPYQILGLARRVSMSLNVFISQLAPPSARDPTTRDLQSQQQVTLLAQAAERLGAESGSLLQLGLSPFKGSREKSEILRSGMQESLLTGALRKNPEVREAVQKALDRRRRGPILQEPD